MQCLRAATSLITVLSCVKLHMQDAVAVWQAVLGEEQPPTVLVGHSMGGAIATRAAGLQVNLIPAGFGQPEDNQLEL